MNNDWGIEFTSDKRDADWLRGQLKPPFEPYLEDISMPGRTILVLRSSVFDGMTSATDVEAAGAGVLAPLNALLARTGSTTPMTVNAVVHFTPQGPRRIIFLSASGGSRSGGAAEISLLRNGQVVESPPRPSRSQEWIRAATLEPALARSMSYMNSESGWVELYKAYEILKRAELPQGSVSKSEIERFKRTANTEARHAEGQFHRLPNPMTLKEARALLCRWLDAGIAHVLQRHS